MKSRFLAIGLVVSTLAFTPTQTIADGYRAPVGYYNAPYNWGGIYAGGSLGWMRTDDIGGAFVFPAAPGNSFIAGGQDVGVAGVHVGAQHQWGNIVLGVEGGARFALGK